MRLNQFTDFGLRILMYLSCRGEKPAATITELSEKFNISRNHLVKVVQFLSKHKVIEAQRGRGGGIKLAGSPENFKIGRLVFLMEQSDCVIDCDSRECILKGNCLLKLALTGAYKEFIRYLDNYTLNDITKGKTEQLLRQLISMPESSSDMKK